MKIKGIIFDGCDKTGKDTIIDLFNKQTNKTWFLINRGPGSLISYGKHYNRDVNFEKYYKTDEMFSKNNFILIYLTADKDAINKRLINLKDDDICYEQIEKIKKEYKKYLQNTKMKTIVVDTSKKNIEETLTYIFEEIKKIGENYYSN